MVEENTAREEASTEMRTERCKVRSLGRQEWQRQNLSLKKRGFVKDF